MSARLANVSKHSKHKIKYLYRDAFSCNVTAKMADEPINANGQQGQPANSMQSKGGKARAEKLSPEQRSEIAGKAAAARWALPAATHKGILEIGDEKIPCAVLDNGKRVISEYGITNAILGSRSGASKRLKKAAETEGALLPLFLAPKTLEPLIDSALRDGPLLPISYMDGHTMERGYDANLLPAVCEIWLSAREKGLLQAQQLGKALKAEILMRSLAKVGITALVDEATGYQEVRNKEALRALLDAFLQKEFAAWAKRFPDDFYKEMFRLRGLAWNKLSVKRPQYIGILTNDVVYERLAPGILEELQGRNPRDEKGRRRTAHHQWLTEDIGHPALAQHLHAVIGLMRASTTWKQFHDMLDKAFPKRGSVFQMELISE
jgi:hypothetical protein